MKKKYIVTGLTCLFLLITGICYSCAYNSKSSEILVSGRSTQNQSAGADQSTETDQNADVMSLELLDSQAGSTADANLDNKTQSVQKPLIFVHICGAIEIPGVYQVEEGARLIDVITLSGGLKKDAAGDYINQAELVSDGQRYYIPSVEDLVNLSDSEIVQGVQSSSEDTKSTLININTADAEELMSLPGIGEAKAGSIITYRNTNGKFKTIEELMNIPGIKEGLFNQVASMIAVK